MIKGHMAFRSKRTETVGQLESLKPHKKISKSGLNWLKEALHFSI
jgi:hypothetical protein